MSSRSTVVDIGKVEIVEEQSEPRYCLTTFVGWDIYVCISNNAMLSFFIENGQVEVRFLDKEAIALLGDRLVLRNVISVEWDVEGVAIRVEAGSSTATDLLKLKR